MAQHKVDIEKALGLLQAGNTTQEVANNFNVSRQAVEIHRSRFIKQGLLQPGRGGRRTKQSPIHLTLEQGIDIMTDAFRKARDYPELEAELEKYKRGYNNLLETMKSLKQGEKKRSGQEAAFALAVQQGEINPLNKKDLTYHILSYRLDRRHN